MEARALTIADVVEIVPRRFEDERGYFSELFRQSWFEGTVAPVQFVQENQSLSRLVGTVRGLHYQRGAAAQGKLVRCLSGAIFDVAVDIRPGSASFGQWVAVTLTPEVGNQLWIPPGFLHGFCTLSPDTTACYKVTAYYSREADAGVAWNDPDIAIAWPDLVNPTLLSAKDLGLGRLRDVALA